MGSTTAGLPLFTAVLVTASLLFNPLDYLSQVPTIRNAALEGQKAENAKDTRVTSSVVSGMHPGTPLFLQSQQPNSANNQTKILYYNIGNPLVPNPAGFGSLINNMLFVASYQRLKQGRHLVVDETDLGIYRQDETHGMISGYFDTSFPTISRKQDYDQLQQETGVNISNLPVVMKHEVQYGGAPIVQVATHDAGHNSFKWARRQAHALYRNLDPEPHDNKIHQFYLLALELCTSMRLNAHTQRAIDNMLRQADIPDFKAVTTVAFHVRRGDKVTEVEHSNADMYIQKLQRLLKDNQDLATPEQLEHCFVATDDYQAFVEVKESLAKTDIACQLHTLATPTNAKANTNASIPDPRGPDDFLRLLAEVQILMDTTFFIGTFTSNIGSLVALWRGCRHPAVQGQSLPTEIVGKQYQAPLTTHQVESQLDHFFHSYGVGMQDDNDEWFIWRY